VTVAAHEDYTTLDISTATNRKKRYPCAP